MTASNLTLRSVSPDLAEILDSARAHAADPAGIEAFTSEWMIGELMKDEPGLTREQAIEQIRDADRLQDSDIILSGADAELRRRNRMGPSKGIITAHHETAALFLVVETLRACGLEIVRKDQAHG